MAGSPVRPVRLPHPENDAPVAAFVRGGRLWSSWEEGFARLDATIVRPFRGLRKIPAAAVAGEVVL